MFMGEYQHAIDPKGRLRVPSKFKDELGDSFIITRGTGRCLFAFSSDEWKAFSQKLRSLPLTDKDAQAFVRLLFAGAAEAEVDAQGRILIPQNLRDHAQLEKDVCVIGVVSRVEIWSDKNWKDYSENSSDNFDEILGKMAEFGI